MLSFSKNSERKSKKLSILRSAQEAKVFFFQTGLQWPGAPTTEPQSQEHHQVISQIQESSYRHFLPLVPDGADDDDVAGSDQDGGDDEEGHGDDGHVDLPLPLLAESDPALRAVVRDLGGVVEVQDGG